jgi:hypothetical protein
MSVTFFKLKHQDKKNPKKAWDNQDIADFYRAVNILKQAGLNTEVDSGVTDEGDPWFVFIRPETGDVIAHFAQIDGQFVAVSSLNQEVYQGQDIRVIVDKMLDRHPLLLPQTENSGRLFLHPTVALSAFLAAAFILTIDAVKASNLGDVIAGAGAENISNIDGLAFTRSIESNLKSESSKVIFSDLTGSNYNVAIVGVALIAHEFAQNELKINKHFIADDSNFGSDGETRLADEELDGNILISSAEQRHLDGTNMVGASLNALVLEIADEEKNKSSLKEEAAGNQEKEDLKINSVFKDSNVETDISLAQELQVTFRDGDLTFKTNYQSIDESKIGSLGDHFKMLNEPYSGDNSGSSNLSLTTLLQYVQSGSNISSLSMSSELILDAGSLGIALDAADGLRSVSLNKLKLGVETETFQNLSLAPFGGSRTEITSVSVGSGETISYLGMDNSLEEETGSHPSDIIQRKPIIGHSLTESLGMVELSDAIDVVFYEGGDVKISKFELGTDLLWFFLSTEELAAAKNNINQNGDLVLDFGDIGKLTFLGMVTETSFDNMV